MSSRYAAAQRTASSSPPSSTLATAPPESGPVHFVVTCTGSTGNVYRVERRYKAFDALQHELWWKGIGREACKLPPKHPQPGSDPEALLARASGLQAWAADIIQDVYAVRQTAVLTFFGLP